MSVTNCHLDECIYATPHVNTAVASSRLDLHNNVHMNENTCSSKPSHQRWESLKFCKYKQSLKIPQRYQNLKNSVKCISYTDEDLDDAILKGHADILNFTGMLLLFMMKQLSVIPVSLVCEV